MSLPHLILTELHRYPMTGYDITKQFKSNTQFYWTASHQQVYRELEKLRLDKLVTVNYVPQTGKPDKKVYKITNVGIVALMEWIDKPSYHQKVRDEFCVKLMAFTAKPTKEYRKHFENLLAEAKIKLNVLNAELNENYKVIAKLEPQKKVIRLAIRKNILFYESFIVWAEEVRQFLDDF